MYRETFAFVFDRSSFGSTRNTKANANAPQNETMSSISLATRTLLRRTAASTGGTLPSAAAVSSSSVRPASTLQETLAEQVPGKQVALASLKKEHGGKVIGNVTIDQLIGGARGVKCMLWETSNLDPEEGIRFRGLTIPECQEVSLRIYTEKEKKKRSIRHHEKIRRPADWPRRHGGDRTAKWRRLRAFRAHLLRNRIQRARFPT